MNNVVKLKPCPLGLPINEMLELIIAEDFAGAIELVRKYIPYPGITGCMCKSPCSRGIANNIPMISEFEHFLYEYELENIGYRSWEPDISSKSKYKVAIVGAGPAGIFAAFELLRSGHKVTIYDRLERPGGMLNLAILPSRLPRHILFSELDILNKLGADFQMLTTVAKGAKFNLRDIRKRYDAVFLAFGAQKVRRVNLPGIDTDNVISVIELFERLKNRDRFPLVKNAIVLGDGNDAVSAAIAMAKLKKSVGLMHLKKLDNMTADRKNIAEAINSGVEFLFKHMPLRILSQNGQIKTIETERLSPETDGNEKFQHEGGHIYEIDAELLVLANGRYPYTKKVFGDDIKTTKHNFIQIDKNYSTGIDGIYAGGECVNSSSGYIYAATSGKNAAKNINAFLKGNKNEESIDKIIVKNHQRKINLSESKTFIKVKTAKQAIKYAKMILDIQNLGHHDEIILID
ncbi:MAG: FAD-dependent oxidoreductase [Candidatus Zixiibacteriota bacterium]